ncbi:MAG: hypothetical protein KF777_24335 [Planctomycetaceae bacterium]|nr:hypothetical protein [Planctomycetaceae bacterium]
MLHHPMNRKEFLKLVMSVFGLALLARWPGGGSTTHAKDSLGAYGNAPYGGRTQS